MPRRRGARSVSRARIHLNNVIAGAVVLGLLRLADVAAPSPDSTPWHPIFMYGLMPILAAGVGHVTMGGDIWLRVVYLVAAVALSACIEAAGTVGGSARDLAAIWQRLGILVIIQGSITVAWFVLFRQVSRRRAVQ